MAGREGKRGECQTRLGLVWRETGAVRNARPSRGQAASTPEEAEVEKDGVAFRLRLNVGSQNAVQGRTEASKLNATFGPRQSQWNP